MNKLKSPFCFSRISIIWLHPNSVLYFFPCTICEGIRSQNCCWGKMGRAIVGMMGWWWDIGGWVFHRLSRRWTQALEVVVCNSLSNVELTPSSLRVAFIIWGGFQGGQYKIKESDTVPSNLPVTLTQMYFYKILKHMILKSLDYFCVTQFCLKCLRDLTVLSSSPSAMFSTANHPVKPAHLLTIPTRFQDCSYPPTCSDLRWIKFPHTVPF